MRAKAKNDKSRICKQENRWSLSNQSLSLADASIRAAH
jgi:hypothetical protein